MQAIHSEDGQIVSYRKQGSGPPLVLVHGSFSDHETNWAFVQPHLAAKFTVYAVARRGRGETAATAGHSLEDEARDIVAVIRGIGEPVFLIGHSYGAHVAMSAAAMNPGQVRKLVLYEPPRPELLSREMLALLLADAYAGDWDEFSMRFFRDVLCVPVEELEAVRTSHLWPPILQDAPATLHDLLAVSRHAFQPGRFVGLSMPVLLQTGSESPRHLYVTDKLAEVLPHARIQVLTGQAHEGMTTAPGLYVAETLDFLEERAAAA